MGYYETTWRRMNWGCNKTTTGKDAEGHWGEVMPDNAALAVLLNDYLKELPAGFEVKSVIPLMGSLYYGTGLTNRTGAFSSEWGGGYGYSSTATIGVLILMQRWVEADAVVSTESAELAPA